MRAPNNPQISAKPPLLCYVTDRNSIVNGKQSVPVDLLLQKIDEVVSAGVDWVQIREKDLSAKDLSRIVREALRIAAGRSTGRNFTRILVNDRLDVALAENAGGVHLGGNSLAVKHAKELVRSLASAPADHDASVRPLAKGFLIGASCHSQEDAQAAAVSGADYIFFGPIFATPSKVEFGAPQGLHRLAEVCHAVPIPVIAIGGITVVNAESCLQAGAAGIAAIRLFQDGVNAAATARKLHQLFTTAPSE